MSTLFGRANRFSVVVALIFGGATGLIACDQAIRQYVHRRNVAKAENFKREFDEQISIGTSRSSVEEFLRTKSVTVIPSMRYLGDGKADVVGELLIEVVGERSVTLAGC
jgi:hypothetical protein